MALGQVPENGRQCRKNTDSSHVSKFTCESICCQHLYLAVGPMTIGPSCSAHLQSVLLLVAYTSSLFPSSLSSLPQLPDNPHNTICTNHCSSKVYPDTTQIVSKWRGTHTARRHISVFIMLCPCPVLLQNITVMMTYFSFSLLSHLTILTGSRTSSCRSRGHRSRDRELQSHQSGRGEVPIIESCWGTFLLWLGVTLLVIDTGSWPGPRLGSLQPSSSHHILRVT